MRAERVAAATSSKKLEHVCKQECHVNDELPKAPMTCSIVQPVHSAAVNVHSLNFDKERQLFIQEKQRGLAREIEQTSTRDLVLLLQMQHERAIAMERAAAVNTARSEWLFHTLHHPFDVRAEGLKRELESYHTAILASQHRGLSNFVQSFQANQTNIRDQRYPYLNVPM